MRFLRKLKLFISKRTDLRLHLIGDSHIGDLKGIDSSYFKLAIEMCCVQGATASGLMNPHSKTLAGPIFNEYISDKIRPEDWVIIHLGEVDCGFLIWVRAEREHISVDEQLELTLENYFSLIRDIRSKTKNIIVLSVIPPTIKDGTKFGNVANLRGQISATQLQRAELTGKLNKRLRMFCNENSFLFLDLDPYLLDKTSGLVRDYFLNESKDNHHLSGSKLRTLVKPLLDAILVDNT